MAKIKMTITVSQETKDNVDKLSDRPGGFSFSDWIDKTFDSYYRAITKRKAVWKDLNVIK